MRGDFNIINQYLNSLDVDKFKDCNSRHLLNFSKNNQDTQSYLQNVDKEFRGVSQKDRLLDFPAATELTTSLLKTNTRIKNMSSIILDIDGSNIVFNKITVR